MTGPKSRMRVAFLSGLLGACAGEPTGGHLRSHGVTERLFQKAAASPKRIDFRLQKPASTAFLNEFCKPNPVQEGCLRHFAEQKIMQEASVRHFSEQKMMQADYLNHFLERDLVEEGCLHHFSEPRIVKEGFLHRFRKQKVLQAGFVCHPRGTCKPRRASEPRRAFGQEWGQSLSRSGRQPILLAEIQVVLVPLDPGCTFCCWNLMLSHSRFERAHRIFCQANHGQIIDLT